MALLSPALFALALAASAQTLTSGAVSPQAHLAHPGGAARRLAAVIRDFEAFRRIDRPTEAAADGDLEARGRLPDPSRAADLGRRAALQGFLGRLAAIPVSGLSNEDALNKTLLQREAGLEVEEIDLDTGRINFDAYSGFHLLAAELANSTVLRDESDAEAYLKLIAALPGYYSAQIKNARRGIATGFTQPRPTVEVAMAVVQRQVERPPEEDNLLEPFDRMGGQASPDRRAALKARGLQLIVAGVKPAQVQLLAFLRNDYLAAARTSLAARDLPNGEAVYALAIRRQTTTSMTPEAIHALGVSEVARIRGEMQTLIQAVGFNGDFKAFQAFLRTDPQFYVASREALLEHAARFNKRVDDALPREFGVLPRLPFAVRQIPSENEESATTAYYMEGSPALGRAGGFMVNTSHLDQRPLYELPALALHESEPGHHLQIALAQERADTPAFRRHLDVNAFAEGWALYAEQLGEEMGVYATPYEHFGRLSYDMWRACRLVADTGLHWLRWSREEARACFAENTALAPKNIEVELDRYIGWPAQALGYKIGELTVLDLRKKAEAALGARFDVRRFHDAVLAEGALPLDLLSQRMDRWMRIEAARP